MKIADKTKFIILIIVIFSCSNNQLNDNLKITLKYSMWACGCPNWGEPKKYNLLGDDFNPVKDGCYIEPANDSLTLPDEYLYHLGNNKIIFTGSFYKNKTLPKNISYWNNPEKGRVFRYTKFELIKPFVIWDYSDENPLNWKTIILK